MTYKDRLLIAQMIAAIMALCLLFMFVTGVFAKQDDKVYWCHCAESGICNTLHLPLQSLQNAGHVNASGNPLHAGDYAGACVEPTVVPTNTPTPTITSNPTPTEEITPIPLQNTPEVRREEPRDTNNTTHTPICSDMTPTRVENIWVERGIANDGKLLVRWGDNELYSKVHIRYSEVDGQWRYALLNTDNDGSEEISDLINGTHYYFQVAYVNGCSVGAFSHSFDPLP